MKLLIFALLATSAMAAPFKHLLLKHLHHFDAPYPPYAPISHYGEPKPPAFTIGFPYPPAIPIVSKPYPPAVVEPTTTTPAPETTTSTTAPPETTSTTTETPLPAEPIAIEPPTLPAVSKYSPPVPPAAPLPVLPEVTIDTPYPPALPVPVAVEPIVPVPDAPYPPPIAPPVIEAPYPAALPPIPVVPQVPADVYGPPPATEPIAQPEPTYVEVPTVYMQPPAPPAALPLPDIPAVLFRAPVPAVAPINIADEVIVPYSPPEVPADVYGPPPPPAVVNDDESPEPNAVPEPDWVEVASVYVEPPPAPAALPLPAIPAGLVHVQVPAVVPNSNDDVFAPYPPAGVPANVYGPPAPTAPIARDEPIIDTPATAYDSPEPIAEPEPEYVEVPSVYVAPPPAPEALPLPQIPAGTQYVPAAIANDEPVPADVYGPPAPTPTAPSVPAAVYGPPATIEAVRAAVDQTRPVVPSIELELPLLSPASNAPAEPIVVHVPATDPDVVYAAPLQQLSLPLQPWQSAEELLKLPVRGVRFGVPPVKF